MASCRINAFVPLESKNRLIKANQVRKAEFKAKVCLRDLDPKFDVTIGARNGMSGTVFQEVTKKYSVLYGKSSRKMKSMLMVTIMNDMYDRGCRFLTKGPHSPYYLGCNDESLIKDRITRALIRHYKRQYFSPSAMSFGEPPVSLLEIPERNGNTTKTLSEVTLDDLSSLGTTAHEVSLASGSPEKRHFTFTDSHEMETNCNWMEPFHFMDEATVQTCPLEVPSPESIDPEPLDMIFGTSPSYECPPDLLKASSIGTILVSPMEPATEKQSSFSFIYKEDAVNKKSEEKNAKCDEDTFLEPYEMANTKAIVATAESDPRKQSADSQPAMLQQLEIIQQSVSPATAETLAPILGRIDALQFQLRNLREENLDIRRRVARLEAMHRCRDHLSKPV